MRRRSFGRDAGRSGRARGDRLPDPSTRAPRAWADSAALRSAGKFGSTVGSESIPVSRTERVAAAGWTRSDSPGGSTQALFGIRGSARGGA